MIVFEIDGKAIRMSKDFHDQFRRCPTVPSFYGGNLDALWDTLTGLVELPLKLIWRDASASREALGHEFDRIVRVLEEAARETSTYRGSFEVELQD
jgi:ribonuclease inhibitor